MKCTACSLSSSNKQLNCASGWGNPNAKLVVLLDCPGDLLAEKLFIWITKRLNLTGQDIWVDYTFKCPIPKGTKKKELLEYHPVCWDENGQRNLDKTKTIVHCGNITADLEGHKKMKDCHGKKVDGIWYIYSFKYLLMNPSECVESWRVLYKAAEEAGLKPKMVVDIPPFRFPTRKMANG